METSKEDAMETNRVNSYLPNSIGIFNIFGNVSEMVAEMVAEKGIAMGGDFATLPSDFKLDYSISYTKPTCRIGFRCVAEKTEH